MQPGKLRALDPTKNCVQLLEQGEQLKVRRRNWPGRSYEAEAADVDSADMTPDEILRLDPLRALAQEVLGNEQAADEWLNTEALGLEFCKPIDLIGTAPGAEAVRILLLRMGHGVYA